MLRRVSPDTEIGRVDDGVATELGEAAELVHRQIDVEQEAVVPVAERVHPEFADDLDAHRLLRKRQFGGVAGAFPPARRVEQDVLVHQRDAHGLDGDRAQHRHGLAGVDADQGKG